MIEQDILIRFCKVLILVDKITDNQIYVFLNKVIMDAKPEDLLVELFYLNFVLANFVYVTLKKGNIPLDQMALKLEESFRALLGKGDNLSLARSMPAPSVPETPIPLHLEELVNFGIARKDLQALLRNFPGLAAMNVNDAYMSIQLMLEMPQQPPAQQGYGYTS